MLLYKGGFYSEGTDVFVISSNRRTLLFSWAWILNLRYFKWLKSCQIRDWVSSEGSNSKMKPYLSLQSHFRHLYTYMTWFKSFKISQFQNSSSGKKWGLAVWGNDQCISTFWIKATFRDEAHFLCSLSILFWAVGNGWAGWTFFHPLVHPSNK